MTHVFGVPSKTSQHIIDPSAQIPAITISAAMTAASANRARMPKRRRPTFFKGPGFGCGWG